MSRSGSDALKNSTTVRFSWTRAAEWLAPRATLDRAFEAWCTPPRPRRARAPKDGRPFELETPVGTLKAWEWGAGECVLLVHGWGSRAAWMEKLVPALVEAGHQVIAFDLPAHGESPGTMTNVVELSRAVESALWRFRPNAVIGHSFGGVASALALRHSPPVQRLVLLASAEDLTYFAHAFAQRAGLSQGIAIGLLTRIEQFAGASPTSLSLRNHPPPPGTQVLVVHDPADDEVPWSHARTLAARWPQAQLLAAPGAGHQGLPRAASVIHAATRFAIDGTAVGATIRVLGDAPGQLALSA
jgi:pimeloyl-ACP methyl ester carboxylesterase